MTGGKWVFVGMGHTQVDGEEDEGDMATAQGKVVIPKALQPTEPGQYELRYCLKAGYMCVARTPIVFEAK